MFFKLFATKSRPEGYPRLFDLITPIDEKYRPVFYAATHDRLVARNLDEGKTVAFRSSRRYDVACLTGELIHSSGMVCLVIFCLSCH